MSSDEEEILSDPQIAWLESSIGDFRVWHIIAFCLGILLGIIIIICCCFRFRIPRTKQEIEADFQRKQITKKFREKLQQIKNSEMDEMDLQKVINRMQADFLSENSLENLCNEKQQQQQELNLKNNLQPPV